jgi:hypothetical protein
MGRIRTSTMISFALAVMTPIVVLLMAVGALDKTIALCFVIFAIGFSLANMLNS